MGLADHARQLVAYNEWANYQLLEAARALTDEQYAALAGAFAHFLGTQQFWHSNWTGSEFEEAKPPTFDALRAAFDASHAEMRDYFGALTDEGWHRSEQWWKRWGYDHRLPLGETLFQVINHSTQHRSEIAGVMSEHGASPGDLDYLVFKQGL
ncbi:MAG: DinB family protein [Dehalococcoidia bacterium]